MEREWPPLFLLCWVLPSFFPSFISYRGSDPLVSFDTWEASALVVERGAFLSVHSFPSQRANGRDREEGNKGPFMATVLFG